MSTPSPRLSLAITYVLALLVAASLLFAYWWQQGRAVPLADAAAPDHKLQCVSYSPFDKDQSPLQPGFVIKPERVDADLALLAKYFTCVRTYSTVGLEMLPDYARKHGLKVLLGAWVSPDAVSTRAEIDALVAAANRHPDVVQAVIVGNEALLRKDIAAPRLAELIAEVKGRVKQPVTYADVWEFWLEHPEIAPAVDFLTIHLLPYWENDPTPVDDGAAVQHVAKVRAEFVRRFAPKDILIGETGWPSHGRQRETAVPSLIDEARFMRGFVAQAEAEGWQYNLIEAFDQPWKRASEGAVGGYWGLFDADRQDKGILTGPVSNLPDWQRWCALAATLAVAVLLVLGLPKQRSTALILPPLAALAGTCASLWLMQGIRDNRDYWEWLWTVALLAVNLLAVLHAACIANGDSGWRRRCGGLRGRTGTYGLGTYGLMAAAFVGAVLMAQLVFDARYRQFPSYAILLPALVYLRWPVAAPRRETLLLLAVIALGIPFQLYEETLANTQALGWAAASALLAAALWRSSRTSRNPASNAANTAGVTV